MKGQIEGLETKQGNQLRGSGNPGRKRNLNKNSGTRKVEGIQGLGN